MISASPNLYVISGPSGVGKNTLADALCDKNIAVRAVTATTRSPRPGESDGEDYFFVSEEKFKLWQEKDELLECNHYNENWYGTPFFSVEVAADSGKPVLLVIDVNGALNVKKQFQNTVLIFILPPSIKELKKRLKKRGKDDAKSIKKRLALAKEELDMVQDYDYQVINGDFDAAIEELRHIIEE